MVRVVSTSMLRVAEMVPQAGRRAITKAAPQSACTLSGEIMVSWLIIAPL